MARSISLTKPATFTSPDVLEETVATVAINDPTRPTTHTCVWNPTTPIKTQQAIQEYASWTRASRDEHEISPRWLPPDPTRQGIMAAAPPKQAEEQRLLWNPENVKDVAESVGIGVLNEEALKVLQQDVEYRLGQVTIESLRFMRQAGRTTLTVQDVSQALKVLDVEPLYGYDSTRPLRYGEASLGPGQPLFYIEDEEVDFEKLINAPLPKVPRDATFTGQECHFHCHPSSRPRYTNLLVITLM